MSTVTLMQALLLADETTPAPALAGLALRTLRKELAHARQVSIPELVDQAVSLGPMVERRFSNPLTEEATAAATYALLSSRRMQVVIGNCTLSWDTSADVIWGIDGYGVESIRAVGSGSEAVTRAIAWADAANSPVAISMGELQ